MIRVYTRANTPSLSPRLVRILLDALDTQPGRVVLVSPWLANVTFSLEAHLASLLGGHRETITFQELLREVSERHSLHIVTQPPEDLLGLRDILRMVEKIEQRSRYLEEEELRGRTILSDIVADLNRDIAELARNALRYYDTLDLSLRLRDSGATLHFLSGLHAKLLWTPAHSFLGSANFTNGGMTWNDELMVEVTDPVAHYHLGGAAEGFINRAVESGQYDFAPALKSAKIEKEVFLSYMESVEEADYPELAAALKHLSAMIH